MSACQPAESHYSRWQTLNDWLAQHQPIWQPAPFTETRPAWVERYPALARLVAALTDAECDVLVDAPGMLAAQVAPHAPGFALYDRMVQLPELSPGRNEVVAATLPEVCATDMPGRKRAQAGAFAAALEPLQHPTLDWCSGKGHLSRTLAARSQKPAEGYEWNPELVLSGNRLAAHFGDAVQIHCQDVMAEDLPMPAGDTHGVALHACGDLHRQLLRRGAAAALPRLSISPCCYHKTFHEAFHKAKDGIYKVLSERAEAYDNRLKPQYSDLRLAVRETVTAPAGVRAQTQTLSQWRLGFDGLQRSVRGDDHYLQLPSCSPRLIRKGFSAFCHWAADKKQLRLPGNTDFDYWLAHGIQRHAEVRRYELLRYVFRRPLELWMVLDYAVFLEEQGYKVRLGHFCTRSLTPRNLLLDAVRVCDMPLAQHSRL